MSPHDTHTMSAAAAFDRAEREAKVAEYRRFVETTLAGRLEELLRRRDGLYEQQAQYQQLVRSVETLERTGTKEVRTRVDLGSNFFAHAEIPDASMLFVSVGLGFHVELGREEIEAFVAAKCEQLEVAAERLTDRAAEVAADIRLAEETLRALAEQDSLLAGGAPRKRNG